MTVNIYIMQNDKIVEMNDKTFPKPGPEHIEGLDEACCALRNNQYL